MNLIRIKPVEKMHKPTIKAKVSYKGDCHATCTCSCGKFNAKASGKGALRMLINAHDKHQRQEGK